MINVCSTVQKQMSEGYLMSPNYPGHYPPNKDCLCTLRANSFKSRLVLSFYDLLLETQGSHCRADWLMLRQNSEKHRHCGAILTGTKTIMSEGNAIGLQFHSDGNDTATQTFQYFTRRLKGFWVHFKGTWCDRFITKSCYIVNYIHSDIVSIQMCFNGPQFSKYNLPII